MRPEEVKTTIVEARTFSAARTCRANSENVTTATCQGTLHHNYSSAQSSVRQEG